MVKTTAPLLSLSAGGQIGKVLTASNWKGRTYLKKLTVPANPNTAAQVGVRSMLKYLSENWSSIHPNVQLTWQPIATAQNITTFDAYIQLGLQRWSTGRYPSEMYPAHEFPSVPAMSFDAATASGRGILCSWSTPPFGIEGGTALYRAPNTGFTPHYTNCIAAFDLPTPGTGAYFDTPLNPGTYYYRYIPFNESGKAGLTSVERNATVT